MTRPHTPSPPPTISMSLPKEDAEDYLKFLIEQYFEDSKLSLPIPPAPTLHNPIRIYEYAWHIARMIRFMGRNNPYRLPSSIYLTVLFFAFMQPVLIMGAAILESSSRPKGEMIGGDPALAAMRAMAQCAGGLLPYILFLFPALIANVRETMGAYGYLFEGEEGLGRGEHLEKEVLKR